MKKGQKTQKKLEFRLKNKENWQKSGLKIVLLGADRDKSGRIGFFGWSGGTSGFGLQIGTVPTRSGWLQVLVWHPVIVVVLKLLLVDDDRCRRFSGSGEASGASDGLCVVSTVTMLHESHPTRSRMVDAVGCKVSGPIVRMSIDHDSTMFLCVCPLRERD